MNENNSEEKAVRHFPNGRKLRVVDIGTEEDGTLCEEGLIIGDICTVEDDRLSPLHKFVQIRIDRNGKLKQIEKTRFELIPE